MCNSRFSPFYMQAALKTLEVCKALEPRLAHSSRSLSQFLQHEAARRLVFLLPLDGMLVHHRSLPRNLLGFPQQFTGTHLYTWVERGTVRVKCLTQEHNTMSPARARTRTARSGVEHTNQEDTSPLTCIENMVDRKQSMTTAPLITAKFNYAQRDRMPVKQMFRPTVAHCLKLFNLKAGLSLRDVTL